MQDAGRHVKERAMNLMWWAEHSSQLELLLLTAVATHLLMSFSQTVMRYRLGHRRLGRDIFSKLHRFSSRPLFDESLDVSLASKTSDGNNTLFFLIL